MFFSSSQHFWLCFLVKHGADARAWAGRPLACSMAAFMSVWRSARRACFSTAWAALMRDSSSAALQSNSSHQTPLANC